MKKRFLILTSLLLIGCSSSNKAFNYDLLKEIQSVNTLTINEELYVNGNNISSKKGTYQKENDVLKGYAYSINRNANFYNVSQNASIVEEYTLNNKYLVKASKNEYEFNLDNNSILSFRGMTEIFNYAINNKASKGEINVNNIMGLVRDFYYDLGYVVDYNSFITDFNLNYTFSIVNNNVTLEIDMINVMKKIYPLVESVSKTYTFSNNFDANIFIEYPSKNNSGNDNKKNDDELKSKSSTYIRNIYSKLEYVSNNLNFILSCPESSRLTYAYLSSNENILTSNGKFNAPEEETNMSLTVILKLDGVEFERQTFTFIAYKEKTRTGELGSKENPLYQGKKKIDKVEIYFIEMHKQYGDSIYIKAGDFDMLIDAGSGDDGYYVSQMLKENMVDSTLDMVVTTHGHSDHIGGMSSALNVPTSITYALDYGYDRADYSLVSQVREKMKSSANKYRAITDALKENDGKIYISDDFYITLLDTNQYLNPGVDINGGDDNSASVTFIMTYKNHSYYFSGDLDSSGESYLVNTNQVHKVDLMKATHHASNSGNSAKLLNVLKPDIVAISAAMVERGDKNSNALNQVHPNQSALSRFKNVGAKVYMNMINGTLHVTSDGNSTLKIEGLGLTRPYYMSGAPVTGEENIQFSSSMWAKRYR